MSAACVATGGCGLRVHSWVGLAGAVSPLVPLSAACVATGGCGLRVHSWVGLAGAVLPLVPLSAACAATGGCGLRVHSWVGLAGAVLFFFAGCPSLSTIARPDLNARHSAAFLVHRMCSGVLETVS